VSGGLTLARPYQARYIVRMPDPALPSTSDDPAAKRNFALLTLYQVLMRTGWIFKTESIVMPAVLDTLSGAAWLRGALPLLNRFGQSLPPVFLAGVVRGRPQKKWVCFGSVASMSTMFVGMAAIWLVPGVEHSRQAPWLFLACYGLFFMFLGVNQVGQLTLQGKLLAAARRGRLLSISNGLGAVAAVACAVLLLPLWLRETQGDFERLFLFTAALFACGAVVITQLREPNDTHRAARQKVSSPLTLAWRTLRRNVAFRRAALVGFLYGTSTILFPHYQRMAQDTYGVDLRRIIWWVALQNIGTGLFSVPMGIVHERYGTRLVLRTVMFGICLIPPTALFLSQAGGWAEPFYGVVFLLIGLSPVALRAFSDYTLEVSPQDDHPQYLGTMNLCISAPILASIPAGGLIDRLGFEPVFYTVTLLLVIGWLCTFSLSEPRKRLATVRTAWPSLDSETAA
jgi:MFS family permease